MAREERERDKAERLAAALRANLRRRKQRPADPEEPSSGDPER